MPQLYLTTFFCLTHCSGLPDLSILPPTRLAVLLQNAIPILHSIFSSTPPSPAHADFVANLLLSHLIPYQIFLGHYWEVCPQQAGIAWPIELPPLSGGEMGLSQLL